MAKSKLMQKLLLAACVAVAGTAAGTPASAQAPGMLPSVGDVEPSAPLPIDGMWTIREIDKRIMIDRGYAYAVDSWVHAFVFRIMPDQIIMKDMRPLPDGSYLAENLPLMGMMRLTPAPDGSLVGTMQGGLPGRYHFDRVDPVGYPTDPYPDRGSDRAPYPDPGSDRSPYPPADDWPGDRMPSEDPDADEERVSPW